MPIKVKLTGFVYTSRTHKGQAESVGEFLGYSSGKMMVRLPWHNKILGEYTLVSPSKVSFI